MAAAAINMCSNTDRACKDDSAMILNVEESPARSSERQRKTTKTVRTDSMTRVSSNASMLQSVQLSAPTTLLLLDIHTHTHKKKLFFFLKHVYWLLISTSSHLSADLFLAELTHDIGDP